MQPRIAVIIVCHNAEAELARCLHALDAGTLRPALIVLVDSGSDSAAYLEGFAARPDIRCLKAGNIGYSPGKRYLASTLSSVKTLNSLLKRVSSICSFSPKNLVLKSLLTATILP